MKRINSILTLIGLTLFACVKLDLEKVDIISFNNQLSKEVGLNVKSSLVQLEDESYFLAGTTSDSSILILGLSEEGLVQSVFEDYGQGVAHEIIKDEMNEEWVLAGNNGGDMFILRIDQNGLVLQRDSFKQALNNILGLVDTVAVNDMILSAEGHIYITGYLKQTLGGRRMLWMKIDQNGEILDLQPYAQNTIGTNILNKVEGGFLLSGMKSGKIILYRINAEGVIIWEKTINNSQASFTEEIIESLDNGSLLITTTNAPDNDILLIKIDPNGDIRWEKKYNNSISTSERGASVIATRDSQYVFLGALGDDLLLSKISKEGDEVWTRRFGGSSNEMPNTLRQVQDNGFIFFSIKEQEGRYFYHILKTDEEGIIR